MSLRSISVNQNCPEAQQCRGATIKEDKIVFYFYFAPRTFVLGAKIFNTYVRPLAAGSISITNFRGVAQH